MVFNNRKRTSLLPDVSRLATSVQSGSWRTAFSTNVAALKQVAQEPALRCRQDELHLLAEERRLGLKSPADSKDCHKSLNETLMLKSKVSVKGGGELYSK